MTDPRTSRPHLAVAVLCVGALTFSCRPTTRPHRPPEVAPDQEKEKVDTLIRVGVFARADDEIAYQGKIFRQFLQEDLETRFARLPVNGSVEGVDVPYAGHWYPHRNGGTNIKASSLESTGALDKYDAAFSGGKNLAANWEKERHSLPMDAPNAAWAGHCNGFAAAAQRHAEPTQAVIRNGVTFQPKDIKALLAEVYMRTRYVFLAGVRCEEEGQQPGIPYTQRDPNQPLSSCQDVNPGAFHVAMGNWIGKRKRAVIIDHEVGKPVWNYPYYSYRSTSRKVSAVEAAAVVGIVGGAPYAPNPAARGFVIISMTATRKHSPDYELLADQVPPGVKPEQHVMTDAWNYVLELDREPTDSDRDPKDPNQEARIIGGEWIGDSQSTHPDFVWVAEEPQEASDNPTNPNPDVNPFVSWKNVLALWQEGTPGAAARVFPGRGGGPGALADWGRGIGYQLTIDGLSAGSVFLSKETSAQLIIDREYQDTDILLALNSGDTITFKGGSYKEIYFKLTAHAGVNTLRIALRRGTQVLQSGQVWFYGVSPVPG